MRCFLGFDLDKHSKLAVQQWREKALPPFEHPVPAANYHVTSVFLGKLVPAQLDKICTQIDDLALPTFSLTFDQLGYWSRPKILYLGCSSQNDKANAITSSLTSIAKQAGVVIQERPYVPHVTLVRKITHGAPCPLMPVDIQVNFSALHLFESVSGKHGVHYPIRYSWQFDPFIKR